MPSQISIQKSDIYIFFEPKVYQIIKLNIVWLGAASAKKNENRRIEKTLRTLKYFISHQLQLSTKDNNISLDKFYNFKEKAYFIKHIVELYNNKLRNSLYGIIPIEIETPLLMQYKSTDIIYNDYRVSLEKNEDSENNENNRNLIQFKQNVIPNYTGD